ncbi:MAG TPA: glutathione S-transferase [Rhizomicrobium sp.]|jgi:glutathione S-transferase
MNLVGQYDSPYARRVAISLRVLGFPYEHDTRSVFGDFEAIRRINPAGRIPVLILDDGRALVDSSAILDWLDHEVGPDRALLQPTGAERQRALQRIALATGAIDKIGAAAYERLMRPEALRWPEWIARCRAQGAGALAVLDKERWPEDAPLDQARITTACAIAYAKLADPELMPSGRFPALDALSAGCEARAEFVATSVADYALPRG